MAGEIVSNVFVIGLDDLQRGQLETVTNAESLAFHRLLPPELVTRPDQRFQDLLDRARGELDAFDGDVHAIIAHWDSDVCERYLWTEEVTDGIVRGVPSDERIAEVTERFPGTHVSLAVDVGDRLSELADQSSYRDDVGTLMIGAQSREELVDRYRTCRELLTLDIEPLEP